MINTDNAKEVNFAKYCDICEFKEKKDYEDPCNECMECPYRESTEVPFCYKEPS